MKRPKTAMTQAQIARAKMLIGTMSRQDIAKEVGTSLSSLKRAFPGIRLAYFNRYAVNPDLVKKVTKFYEQYGRRETEKKFPEVKVRSVVERYKLFKPRQSRWTEDQIHQLVKFAGLISMEDQAKHFNRPLANRGSIQSAWMKKFGVAGSSINGMSEHRAKYFVTEDCPRILTYFWQTQRKHKRFGRKLYLWADMENHLRPDCPNFVAEAIKAMAEFQRWVFKTDDVQSEVRLMLSQFNQEATNGN